MSETITAYADPEGEAPWALQLVVRAEKSNPPTHTATLTAVARTVVALIDRIESGALTGDTDVNAAAVEALGRWRAGRIRKVVRRARGAAWTNSDLPSALTRTFDGVEVRSFVPGPTDQVPAELRKLQVSGLDLADPAEDTGDVTAPVVIHLNPDVVLSTGKAAAQVAHAAQLVYEQADPVWRRQWADADAPLRVHTPTREEWASAVTQAQVRVTDAGFTEIPAGTMTCVAVRTT